MEKLAICLLVKARVVRVLSSESQVKLKIEYSLASVGLRLFQMRAGLSFLHCEDEGKTFLCGIAGTSLI